jgi:serine/threonine protein kinase
MTEEQGQGGSGKLGRYKVVYELGQGAMGTVFRGHDPSIDRQVALKTINVGVMGAAQEAEFRERLPASSPTPASSPSTTSVSTKIPRPLSW